MISYGVLAGLATMFAWGLNDFLFSFLVRKIGVIRSLAFSHALLFLMILPFYVGDFPGIEPAALAVLFIANILNVGAVYFLFKSFTLGELAVVSPISSSYAIITVILSLLFLGEMLHGLTAIGIVAIIVGLVLASTDIRKIRQLHTVAGVREAFGAMVLWGFYFFIIGWLSRDTDFSALFFYGNLFIAVLFVLWSLRSGLIRKGQIQQNLPLFVITSALAAVGWLALFFAMSQDLTSVVTPISSLYPAVTVLMAIIFLREKLLKNQVVGIVLILGGLLLINL